jgi:hypothetical protein
VANSSFKGIDWQYTLEFTLNNLKASSSQVEEQDRYDHRALIFHSRQVERDHPHRHTRYYENRKNSIGNQSLPQAAFPLNALHALVSANEQHSVFFMLQNRTNFSLAYNSDHLLD